MATTDRFQGQSDFAIFLRTGLRFRHQEGANVEVKFNPWHDPDDGQFTFVGQGRYYGPGAVSVVRQSSGQAKKTEESKRKPVRPNRPITWGGDRFTGGGGGSGGGAGATGPGWETAEEQRQREAREAKRRAPRQPSAPRRMLLKPVIAAVPAPDRFRSTIENGYRYDVDDTKRTRKVEGDLVLAKGRRSSRNQAAAGKPDRRTTDHGGHYIAVRFNGSHRPINHFAQDGNFNQSAYRRLEDEWETYLRAGKAVHVKIVPLYQAGSQRPYQIDVEWTVDGQLRSKKFPNEKGNK